MIVNGINYILLYWVFHKFYASMEIKCYEGIKWNYCLFILRWIFKTFADIFCLDYFV